MIAASSVSAAVAFPSEASSCPLHRSVNCFRSRKSRRTANQSGLPQGVLSADWGFATAPCVQIQMPNAQKTQSRISKRISFGRGALLFLSPSRIDLLELLMSSTKMEAIVGFALLGLTIAALCFAYSTVYDYTKPVKRVDFAEMVWLCFR